MLAIEGRQHATRRGDTFEETGEIRAPQTGDHYLGKFGDQQWPATCTRAGDPADDGAGVDRIILRKVERPTPYPCFFSDPIKLPPSEPWVTFSVDPVAPDPHIMARIGGSFWQTPSAVEEVGPETRARRAEVALRDEGTRADQAEKMADAQSARADRAEDIRDRAKRIAVAVVKVCRTLRADRDKALEQRDRARENAQMLAGELYRMVLAYEQAQGGRVEAEAELRATRDELRDFEHVEGESVAEMASVAVTAYGFAQHSANTRADRVRELEAQLTDAEDALTEGIRDDLAAGGLL